MEQSQAGQQETCRDLLRHSRSSFVACSRCVAGASRWAQLDQTIKGDGAVCSGLHQRMEWESQIADSTPDLSKITNHALLKLFSHHGLRDRLQPVFITIFRRTNWLLSFAEGDEIELSLDQGELKAGQSVAPVCEVELELKAGRPEKLYEMALQLLESVQLMPENSSKADRGYALYSGAPALPVKAAPPGLM